MAPAIEVDDWSHHPDESHPAEYKTECNGEGGLVRVRFVDPPWAGRSLYIDELDLPPVIYTSAGSRRFEWWTERTHALMRSLPAGSDPDAMPVRYELQIPHHTRQPVLVAAPDRTGTSQGQT